MATRKKAPKKTTSPVRLDAVSPVRVTKLQESVHQSCSESQRS